MKKITYRQEQFLRQFLDIYREIKAPVHYITVAERLGVGNITAYEMLRLLEDYGLLSTEYQINPEQHGPGRSQVLFYPTKEADLLIKRLTNDPLDIQEWETVKEQILETLRTGNAKGYDDLLANLLSRSSEKKSPLIFATEMITSVILTLISLQDRPEIQNLLKMLGRIGFPHEIGLSVMSGITMFLSALENTNRHTTSLLLAQMSHYEDVISQLNKEKKGLLNAFTREVVQILSG
jgi:predicted transcriptional regulator